MDPFSIAALVAMLGGTAMQMKASSDANKRKQQAISESQNRQRAFQRQAESRALSAANDFNPEKRQDEQHQIAQQVEQELIQPVAATQAANDINSRASGDVSNDYDAAKSVSNLNQMKNAEALARLLGKTTSASRLRQNEAVRNNDAAMDIGRIKNFSEGQYNADQLGIESAGVQNPWMSMGGSLLQNAGGLGLATGGGGISGSIGKLFAGNPTKAAAAAGAKTLWGAPPIP